MCFCAHVTPFHFRWTANLGKLWRPVYTSWSPQNAVWQGNPPKIHSSLGIQVPRYHPDVFSARGTGPRGVRRYAVPFRGS